MKATIKHYPGGEVRLAVFPERPLKDLDEILHDPDGVIEITDGSDLNHTHVQSLDSSKNGAIALLDIKSKVDRVGRRLRMALSRYGRRTVLRAGNCFDMSTDSERLLLTGTLPGSTIASFRALAQFSNVVTKKLTNWLTYHEPSCKWMYVWEFQGRGALHLHLVCEAGLRSASFIKANFKEQWNRCLSAVQLLAGVDMYQKTSTYSHSPSKTQADVTICDREPSRYICKYMSKGSTHAKGFNRFPPKQWYQVSRSLLRVVRERTEEYSIIGLSYFQALRLIDETRIVLDRLKLSGQRRFEGRILSWSGHGYDENFHIEDWDRRFMSAHDTLTPTSLIAKHAISTSKSYPQTRCYLRAKMRAGIEDAMLQGLASETEMLMLIQSIADALGASWETMHKQGPAARFILRHDGWFKAKYGYTNWTPEFILQLNKVCNDDLTPMDLRTKV